MFVRIKHSLQLMIFQKRSLVLPLWILRLTRWVNGNVKWRFQWNHWRDLRFSNWLRYECPEDQKDALQDCKCSINSSLRFRQRSSLWFRQHIFLVTSYPSHTWNMFQERELEVATAESWVRHFLASSVCFICSRNLFTHPTEVPFRKWHVKCFELSLTTA